MEKPEDGDEVEWRTCRFDLDRYRAKTFLSDREDGPEQFWSTSDNPYSDRGHLVGWLPLPNSN